MSEQLKNPTTNPNADNWLGDDVPAFNPDDKTPAPEGPTTSPASENTPKFSEEQIKGTRSVIDDFAARRQEGIDTFAGRPVPPKHEKTVEELFKDLKDFYNNPNSR